MRPQTADWFRLALAWGVVGGAAWFLNFVLGEMGAGK